MAQRINFTGRRRITRDRVDVQVRRENDGLVVKVASLDLSDLNAPPNASIFLEIYHQTYFRRTQCGTVAHPVLPHAWAIEDFAAPECLRCRVKVVDSDANHAGRIIAVGDKIPVAIDDNEATQRGLLPIAPEALGGLLWRLDVSENPQLLINSDIPDWKAVAQQPWFRALVYPEAVRRVALWCFDGVRNDIDDPELATWLKYFELRLDIDVKAAATNDVDATPWADDVSMAFADRFKIQRVWAPLVEMEGTFE